MSLWKHYHTPKTVDEALDLLAAYDGAARVVAGGTDLILEMHEGRRPPVKALIDITHIDGLGQIRHEGNWITIGAAVTHTQIVESPLIQEHGAALAEGSSVVGGPQVRNVGTLCGNVAHALPAADGTVALAALGAEGQVTDRQGSRWVPLLDLFEGPGRSAVDATRELLTAVRFRPTGEREASAFTRVMRPQGVALPMFVVAAMVRLDPARERFEKTRVSLGPVAPVPYRSRVAEEVLRGAVAGDVAYQQAVEAALTECHPRTSKYRATSEYRLEMIKTLLPKALTTAVARVRGEAWAAPRLELADKYSSFGSWRAR
ncbi:MAG: FAD binding domain-containing protein [Anaerolineae bacterium]